MNGRFDKFLIRKPALVLCMLSCAAASCYFKTHENGNNHQYGGPKNIYSQLSQSMHEVPKFTKDMRFKINARIINFDELNSLKQLKSHSVEKFVVIRGTVIRIGLIKPLVLSMQYQCRRCGSSRNVKFLDGKTIPITDCPSETGRCKSKNPRPLSHTAHCIDYQKIRYLGIYRVYVYDIQSVLDGIYTEYRN